MQEPAVRENSLHDSQFDSESASPVSGTFQMPPPFQLKAGAAAKGGGGMAAAPIQRVEAGDIVGNVSAGHSRRGQLDVGSNRRIIERIAQLEGANPVEAGQAFMAMSEADRATALEQAITRFQHSPQGQALITQIMGDNGVESGGREFYERPRTGARSQFRAPQAEFTDGAVENNDVTMQALANAWPRNFFGRLIGEEQAYGLIRSLLRARSLPFNENQTNVVSIRGFQGGELHDNDEGERNGPFSRQNTYNDTTYILSTTDGEHHVSEHRSTVDPGNGTSARSQRSTFQMEADQQWEYSGNSRGQTAKFDRPMYGLANREEVTRGRYWIEHPEELAAALERGHAGARVISDRGGREFADVNPAGQANRVSAIHSGGRGGATGDQVMGDSTGCSVVHGAWFAHFNESLRRASPGAGDQERFTYSLLDLSLFDAGELETVVSQELSGMCDPAAQDRCQ